MRTMTAFRGGRSTVAGLLVLTLVALACGEVRAEDPAPAPALSPIEKLRALTEVGGSAVGEAGGEGEFFALMKVLLEKSDEASWRGLLAEKSPVARAMGLTLFVRAKGKDAMPEVRSLLSDRERILQLPGGCCGETVTVGEFARALARNRRHLEMGAEPEPLVDVAGRLAIDLSILADDRMATAHGLVAWELTSDKDFAKADVSLAGLRRLLPDLTDTARVKAIARSPESERVRALLVACVGDDALAADARLAAASGLTLHVHPDAEGAIRRARAALDAAAGSPVADRLLATIDARREFERKWAPIDAEKTWKGQEAMADKIREALVADHPLALEKLISASGLAVVTGPLREAQIASLFRIAGRVGDHAKAWDAYAVAPYLLEAAAIPRWGERHDDSPLHHDEAKRLLELLRPHLAAR